MNKENDYQIKVQKAEMLTDNKGNIGFALNWSANIGFGELCIVQDTNGELSVDAEYMSLDFVKQCLTAFCDNLKWVKNEYKFLKQNNTTAKERG